ncbi:uncharacterized protein LOC142354075 [Convolutriloba macropyga]|uniref:uncharacterized protein LOC142354075 n=1 Tax=Convolutriloba macropyga TaxID=536237 RepID=UPI003F526CBF
MSERDGARKRRRSSERTSENNESQLNASTAKPSQNPSKVASGSGTQTGSLEPSRNQTLGTVQTGPKAQSSQKPSGPASLGQSPSQGFRKSENPTWPESRPSQKSETPQELQSGQIGSEQKDSSFFQQERSNTRPTKGQSEVPPESKIITAGKSSGASKVPRQSKGSQPPSYPEPGPGSKISGGQQTQNPVPGSSIKGGTQRPPGSQNFQDKTKGNSEFGKDPGGKEIPGTKSGGSQIPGGSQETPGGIKQPPGGIKEPPGGSQEPPGGGPQQPGGGKGQKVRRKPKRCPVHVEHDILFHCHACNLDICKLCWKLGHTGNSERHHDVVFIEFMKQKEFAERLDKFNLDERLVEIDYQSKLCEKTSTHLKNLIEKLMKERSILKEETEICDTLIMKYGKLQAMARAQNFDHTNKDVVQFMALTDNPYDTREPIMSEEDKEDLEGIIDQLQNLVLERSPESSAAISVMPDQSSFN